MTNRLLNTQKSIPIAKTIGYNATVKIDPHKTIRPTQLQPQLYSRIKALAENNDYLILTGKGNKPLCILAAFDLLKDIDLETSSEALFARELQEYYAKPNPEETELMDAVLEDIYDV